tara:strand:+ start:98 stop:328 length:231 start_codon:yes stop_codon:yes gene_type:complete
MRLKRKIRRINREIDMFYILRLKAGGRGSRVDRVEANSMNEATNYFIERKRMKEDTFNKLYMVEEDISDIMNRDTL